MLNIPPETLEQIKDATCRPEGSVTFEYSSPVAFKKDTPGGILLQIQTKGHIFHLERTDKGLLNFYHSSPGTLTRVSTIDLNDMPDFERAFLAFTWSPKEMHFYCGPRVSGASLVSSAGKQSSRQFRVGEDGSIFEIGDEGIQVMGARVYQGNKLVLTPTGIEAWRNTLKAIEILWTGKSDQGFIFESVTSTLTLSILVTGLETYTKTRFCELETEGIKPNISALFASFSTKTERDLNIFDRMQQEALENRISLLKLIVDIGRINFQSYDQIKRAYKAAYGIKLGEISLSSQMLNDIQRFIEYRHRVVHVSPLIGILNEGRIPTEEPVFANRALAERAMKCFDEVVTKLHESTLSLKRED